MTLHPLLPQNQGICSTGLETGCKPVLFLSKTPSLFLFLFKTNTKRTFTVPQFSTYLLYNLSHSLSFTLTLAQIHYVSLFCLALRKLPFSSGTRLAELFYNTLYYFLFPRKRLKTENTTVLFDS